MTAPYTFVDFTVPTPASLLGDNDGAVFDRPIPGRRTGHIDLELTTLTPLFIGGGEDNDSFTLGGNLAIPGSSIKGCLRALSDAMFGAVIAVAEDREIWYRSPVQAKRSEETPAQARRFKGYRSHRGLPPGPGGSERIGLITRTEDGYTITECARFGLTSSTGHSYLAVPKVRRDVAKADLNIKALTLPDSNLQKHNQRPVSVVWAAVRTIGQFRGKPCPPSVRYVPYALGADADRAVASAKLRRDQNRSYQAVPRLPRGFNGNEIRFVSFLDAKGDDSDEPIPVEMVFSATSLAHDEGVTQTKNVYLFAIPGSLTAEWIANTGGKPKQGLSIDSGVVGSLKDPANGTGYQQGLPKVDDLLAGAGVPVFFDEKNGKVVRVGRSGGFRVKAQTTVNKALERAGLVTTSEELTVSESLFGTTRGERRIRGRVEVGHAFCGADPAVVSLDAQRIALLSPKIEADYLRLKPGHDGIPPLWDSSDAQYRGIELFLHRGNHPGGGDDQQRWQAAADEFRQVGVGNAAANDNVGADIRPVRTDVTFHSRIRFVNLTDAELGALLLLVSLGNPRDTATNTAAGATHAHKIGGAKPLGLGSVHFRPTVYEVPSSRYRLTDSNAVIEPQQIADVAPFIEACKSAVGAGEKWPHSVTQVLAATQWRGGWEWWNATAPMSISNPQLPHDHRRRPSPPSLDRLFDLDA